MPYAAPSDPRPTPTLDWIFDPLPPSGAIQGGTPTAHVFRPDLDTFVREVLQNARDQRVGKDPVRVNFVFERLEGQAKQEFLEAIAWPSLRPHIEAAAAAGFATVSGRLREGLRAISDGPILVLRIEDSGTWGLTGGEDERGGNFCALCRNVLDTSEERQLRGGSFGLGKAVLWSFSSISTVLFSSRISGNPRPGFRFFGRCELPYHETHDRKWDGPGWYGQRELAHAGDRAVSAWDEAVDLIARRTGLFRGAHLGDGTSILIVGFSEPREEVMRHVQEIAGDLEEAASRWFWPSLKSGSLEVTVRVHEPDEPAFERRVGITEEVRPFVQATYPSAPTNQATQPGDVAERPVHFRVPTRRARDGDQGDPPRAGMMTLRIRYAEQDDVSGPASRWNRTVALVRGSGMVIRYRRVRGPLGDTPFHGVLLAGLANGQSESDEAIERFLRAAEPPSHNDWDARTDRVRYDYHQGGGARLRELWEELDRAIPRMLEEPLPPESRGPQLLARLFRIGGRDGRPPEGIVSFRPSPRATFKDGVWHFSGQVRREGKVRVPWQVEVRLWLAGETGRGDALPIARIRAQQGDVTLDGEKATIRIPGDESTVTFEGVSHDPRQVLDEATLRRTRMRLDVRAAARDSQ